MNTLKFGNGEWYGKKDTILAYNDENSNYKPLPFNFERDSSATVVNKDGLIETVSAGMPRIDYKDNSKGALLLEPSRTNSLPYSANFSTWSATGGASVIGDKLGVGGSNDAFEFFSDGTANTRLYYALSNTGELSFSVFAKKNTLDYIALYGNGGANPRVWFNLANGTLGNQEGAGTGSIESYGNGWYRCTMNWTSASLVNVRIYNSNENDVFGGTAGSVFMQYAQLEAGSYATSYIPTSGSTATRLADSCLKEDINTSIINSSYPFSMYAESTYIGGNKNVLSFSKKVVSNNYYQITINTNEVMLDARANGSTELIESGVTLLDGQKFKVAVTMESATSGKICVNGSTVVSKTNFSNQAVNNEINDLLLGQLRVPYDTGERLPVTDVKLYNTALTDQELIALTQV